MPLYFNMPSISTLDDIGAEAVVIESSTSGRVRAGRQLKTATMYDSKWNELCGANDHMSN